MIILQRFMMAENVNRCKSQRIAVVTLAGGYVTWVVIIAFAISTNCGRMYTPVWAAYGGYALCVLLKCLPAE